MSLRNKAVLAGCVLAALFPYSACAEEGKRVALIVGNNSYPAGELKNAVNDARAMDKALQAANFKTILRENVTRVSLATAVAEFLQQLGPDDTALFFYAGHGVQIENENFLVPVDFQAANSVIEAKFQCFSTAQLLDELKKRPKRSIVILDACRSNPLAQNQSLQAGLAQPQNAGKETFIAFSTAPGQVAADNPTGRNSWFTEALADIIGQKDLTLDNVFTRVKARVAQATDGRQTPWTTSSLSANFYFHPPSNAQNETEISVAEKWLLEARQREQRQDWDIAIALVNQILARKPGGTLEAAARNKLPYLLARQEAQAHFEANDFAGAAALYEKALAVDPFSIDAMLSAAFSRLLNDQTPEAVQLLGDVRSRGTTGAVEKANAMLKELATVYPEAAKVQQAGLPDPPAITELFRDVQFDIPDWQAGTNYILASPVELASWVRKVEAAWPPPSEVLPAKPDAVPEPAVVSMASAEIAGKIFHVQVVPIGDTRDLVIRKIGAPGAGTAAISQGFLVVAGTPGPVPVVFNGRFVAQQLPATLTLPAGKYEVRTVEDGKVLGTREIEISNTGISTVKVDH